MPTVVFEKQYTFQGKSRLEVDLSHHLSSQLAVNIIDQLNDVIKQSRRLRSEPNSKGKARFRQPKLDVLVLSAKRLAFFNRTSQRSQLGFKRQINFYSIILANSNQKMSTKNMKKNPYLFFMTLELGDDRFEFSGCQRVIYLPLSGLSNEKNRRSLSRMVLEIIDQH